MDNFDKRFDDFDKRTNRIFRFAQVAALFWWLVICAVLSGVAFVVYRLLLHFGVL